MDNLLGIAGLWVSTWLNICLLPLMEEEGLLKVICVFRFRVKLHLVLNTEKLRLKWQWKRKWFILFACIWNVWNSTLSPQNELQRKHELISFHVQTPEMADCCGDFFPLYIKTIKFWLLSNVNVSFSLDLFCKSGLFFFASGTQCWLITAQFLTCLL